MSYSSDALFSGDDGAAATAAADDGEGLAAGDAALSVSAAGNPSPQPPRPSWSTVTPMSDNYYG